MQLKAHIEVGARFKLIKHKGNPQEPVQEIDYFNNLVLDSGLDRLSVGSAIGYVSVGSGNSVPVVTQTTLDNRIASTNTVQGSATFGNQTSVQPYYGWARQTYRFGAGVAAGNLSEIGIGWSTTDLFNRALIKDTNGNPTTITVLSDEYLDVIVELRTYPQQTITGSFNLLDKIGNIKSTHTISGTCLFRSTGSFMLGKIALGTIGDYGERMEVYSGDITNSPTTSPSGTVVDSDFSATTYPTSRSCRNKAVFPLNIANMNHRSFVIPVSRLCTPAASYNGYKIQIDPPIIKNNTMELQYTFELSWDRYVA